MSDSSVFADPAFQVSRINYVEAAKQLLDAFTDRRMFCYDGLLPLLFRLHGKPFTLKNHFQFVPLFNRVLPPQITYKTARQVAKSQSNAAHSALIAGFTPYYNILHVHPLGDMSEKFSSNYVAPLLEESPLKGLFLTPRCKKAKQQRTLRNGSNLIFTYAFLDCTRTRGITANAIKYDEYQSMDASFEPIINQTISAVHAGVDFSDEDEVREMDMPLIMRFGTPLTFENGLEQAWETSSQAEWVITCGKCGRENVPSLREDLEKMMGPRERKEPVTPQTPGIVCAKCGQYLYTRTGRWKHAFPERRTSHAGYHIPQCIMPFHCDSQDAWTELQQYRFNRNKAAEAEFYHECCGESYDHGSKLISVTDLRQAALLPPRSEQTEHLKAIRDGRYKDWGMGVDWGGGGMSGLSKTAFAFAGMRNDGIIEVFSGYRSQTPNDFNLEADRTKSLRNTYQCRFLAMDFNGPANRMRWDKLLEIGIPSKITIPISYLRVGNGAVVQADPPNRKELIPGHLQLNKTRAFLGLSHLIRTKKILFFQYDYKNRESPGLLYDFTSLVEERVPLRQKGEIYTIIHVPTIGPDDFANAVNYVVCALYFRNGGWPDTREISTLADLTPEQQRMIGSKYRDTDMDWFFREE
jgi:hypothetical protein